MWDVELWNYDGLFVWDFEFRNRDWLLVRNLEFWEWKVLLEKGRLVIITRVSRRCKRPGPRSHFEGQKGQDNKESQAKEMGRSHFRRWYV